MAILKHIASKNADYSAALEYLLFQHNEKTQQPILDGNSNKIMREEYYMDGINCDPFAFDIECEKLNASYHKNQKKLTSNPITTSSASTLLIVTSAV